MLSQRKFLTWVSIVYNFFSPAAFDNSFVNFAMAENTSAGIHAPLGARSFSQDSWYDAVRDFEISKAQ